MLSKALVFTVIVLFIGMSVVPSISSDVGQSIDVIKDNDGNIGICAFDTYTFYPTGDTCISKYPTEADSNHGLREDLHIRNTYGAGGNDNYQVDVLTKFDVSSIPVDTTIISATLNYYYFGWYDNNPASNDLNLYKITSDWEEEIVTWNTQPTYASLPTDYSTVPSSTGLWMDWDVTTDVQDFVDGTESNYGWKITDETYWGSFDIPVIFLYSRENSTYIPYLEIETADIYVDDNADPGWYDATHVRTIQEGIDNATAGDTVFVYHGSYDYFEIDKVLYLIGEDKNTTFINGGLKISADRVNISGFTIYNALKSGLYVASSNNYIFNNNIINNGYAGIDLRSNSNSIYENYIANNPTGISCDGSNHEIVGNTIKDSEYDGISLVPSNNNNISNNILINNGLSIWHPWFYSYYHNVVLNNTVNGKPLIYIERGIDTTLAMDAGQIILINCNNITILNQNISNSSVGIMLWNTSNCSISNSVIYGQYYGIFMCNSTDNEIVNNDVSNNTIGVFPISSINGIIFSNTILNNFLGLSIGNSLNNSVIKNKISHNNYGITLNNSCYNQIYHNIFIDNDQNAQDASTNIWDNDYPSGGNYWDDYTGTDADGDGIGDTPYDIPGGDNQDRYPLGFFHPVADANGPYTETNDEPVEFNGSGSYDPDGTIISYEWDFGDGHSGTGVKPSHKYSSSGTYNITLTVTDDDGLTDTNDTTAVIGHGNRPTIQLIYPTGGEILKDTVTIRWYAIDSEDGSNLPIYLFYSDDNFETWYQINDVLDNTGEYEWDTTRLPDGTYELLIEAVDSDNNIGHDSSEPFQIKNHDEPPENHPPNKPNRPSGPTSGKAGTSYSYSSSTTDPDTVTASHVWDEKGDYNIKVKAKDVHGEESPWSDLLPITMPKNKAINPFLLFLERLIECFPILERVLQPIYNKLACT